MGLLLLLGLLGILVPISLGVIAGSYDKRTASPRDKVGYGCLAILSVVLGVGTIAAALMLPNFAQGVRGWSWPALSFNYIVFVFSPSASLGYVIGYFASRRGS